MIGWVKVSIGCLLLPPNLVLLVLNTSEHHSMLSIIGGALAVTGATGLIAFGAAEVEL